MLQSYTFTIQVRKGSQNANADVLSRLPELPALCVTEVVRECNRKCAEEIADQVEDCQQVDQNKKKSGWSMRTRSEEI